jgi:ubiquinone/menaquinone biosynthesis C-methylase UbiE
MAFPPLGGYLKKAGFTGILGALLTPLGTPLEAETLPIRIEDTPTIEERLRFPENDPGKKHYLRGDGIWDFVATTDARQAAHEPETRAYQNKYQSVQNAARYNEGYKSSRQKRTRRESRILDSLLSGFPKAESILDMPCGGGRLSPALANATNHIVEMDLSLGQLIYGRENSSVPIPRTWIRGSGFEIPLQDGSVEGAACIRLSHHLYSMEEKEKLLSELIRVTRSFVIFSFVDRGAPKFVLRRWRDRLAGRPHRTPAISVPELRALANQYGGELLAYPALGPFSAHRYALIRKV